MPLNFTSIPNASSVLEFFLSYIDVKRNLIFIQSWTNSLKQFTDKVDYIVFYAVLAIFRPYNGGDYIVLINDNQLFPSRSSRAYSSCHRNPVNGLLRATGVVILDTGHHLTSHPTDINGNSKLISVKYRGNLTQPSPEIHVTGFFVELKILLRKFQFLPFRKFQESKMVLLYYDCNYHSESKTAEQEMYS